MSEWRGRVEHYLRKRIAEEGCIHLTLIDPEKTTGLEQVVRLAENAGTAGFMVGGSTVASQREVEAVVDWIRKVSTLPIILFPNGLAGLAANADAVFFMSLFNATNPYFITGVQALAAPLVKRLGLEPIPLAYLIVEPGGSAAFVGAARSIPRNHPELAAAFAQAAELLGLRFVYLEAGSGAADPLPPSFVRKVASATQLPLIVGGGIRTAEHARILATVGARIIVTGTLAERSPAALPKIIHAVQTAGQ